MKVDCYLGYSVFRIDLNILLNFIIVTIHYKKKNHKTIEDLFPIPHHLVQAGGEAVEDAQQLGVPLLDRLESLLGQDRLSSGDFRL